MYDFLRLENLKGDFKNLLDAVRGGKATTAFSLVQGAKNQVTSAIPGVKLLIVPDRLAAETAYTRLKAYVNDRVVFIPDKDDVLLNRKAGSVGLTGRRIEALTRLIQNKAEIAVIPAEALLQYYPNVDAFRAAHVTLMKEEEYAPEKVANKLVSMGYTRVESMSDRGEFSLRGDVLDVYPLASEYPIRISYFDDLVESIKYFRPETMESVKEIGHVTLSPATDVLITRDEADKIIEKIKKHRTTNGGANDVIDDVIGRLELNPTDRNLVWITPFIDERSVIFDYLPRDATIIVDEPKLLYDKLELIEKEHSSRVKSLVESGEVLPIHKESILTRAYALTYIRVMKRLAFQQLTALNPVFESSAVYTLKSQQPAKYYLDRNVLYTDVKNFNATGYKVMLCCGDENRAKNVSKSLKENDIYAECDEDFSRSKIIATKSPIRVGFIYHQAKLVVLGMDELFGKIGQKTELSKPKTGFIQLKTGDYVVHEQYGIGVCEGSDRITVNGITRDYVVLRYRDGGKLFVPIDQMDMLTKFSGGETPKLNKLGGDEFKKTKEKAKASIRKLAFDLLKLYQEREKQKGYKYSPDTPWQREFEENFEYDLTDDQDRAVREIKDDMEKGRVMDRLVCGDVGYGKTEVSFRAAFKTVMDNKQVAILAPTTILAKQHFNTLNARLQGFGIKTVLLSRLQSDKEIDRSLKEIEDGVVSIVVGTHRILSKDVAFHDLGLLILDEEQRFGVEHKEKLKTVKKDVNVLTLTATPIPRTLNLALSGVRDISLLETPPKNRLPVQNYVVEYSDGLLKDAVMREVSRGGQVFILYNYVETIEAFAEKVRKLVDGKARVMVAHGQMGAGELDKRMTSFYQREADVLIATTIIENGIDLPDANTLFVIDADRFGLSTLYQLRGRVGRSGALAHAYFTTRLNKVLTDDAVKRLTALTEYSDFGSGFKISLRDLEIRGAGTFLGAEQHGHIEKVGYELYSKMLKETVEEIKNGGVKKENNVLIKIDVDAYVPEDYVGDGDKIRVYKRISEVTSVKERDELIAALSDVYGPVSAPLKNLIDIALLKSLAGEYDVEKIVATKKGAAFVFRDASVFKEQNLLSAVAKLTEDVVLTATVPPQLLFNTKGMTVEQVVEKMINFLLITQKS
jgi:transcription-repair coupling factor (superfamily II helicase)